MNSWFQFKQFIIHQDKTAMKVCTDACLFGALVAKKMEQKEISAENILDIGCGTGLLSLMLAQKSNAQIDAVEIDENAYEQALRNIHLTTWENKIEVHHSSILHFHSQKKYELIICNPPFYEGQLKSTDGKRNGAMHATMLSFLELAVSIKYNLTKNGTAAILLPESSVKNFEEICVENNLFVFEKLHVCHSPLHPYFRCVLLISDIKKKIQQEYLSIKNADENYSSEFIYLLQDYYLNL